MDFINDFALEPHVSFTWTHDYAFGITNNYDFRP